MKKILTILISLFFLSAAQAYALNPVAFGPQYYPEDDRGRPIANGYIYVGEPDTDPEVVGNQKSISVQQEDGTILAVSQPIRTSAGGVPQYGGESVVVLVDGGYSLKVLNSAASQVYYIPKGLELDNEKLSYYSCDLAAAVADKGSSVTTLDIDCAAIIPDSTTVIIPATLTLLYSDGDIDGVFGGGTETLTYATGSMPYTLGKRQIYGDNLTVTNLKTVYPEDFGAAGDNVTDDGPEFNRANAALISSGGIMILLADAYYIETPFVATNPFTIEGNGKNGKTTLRCAKRTAPNTNVSSSTIIAASGLDGIVIRNISFDGDVTTYVNVDQNDAWLQALIDIDTSTNILIENCDFTKFFRGYPLTSADATYKVAPVFIYSSSSITIRNSEHIATATSPSYGNGIMLIDVQDVEIDRFIQVFDTGVATGVANESPINIWGETTQNVWIHNCRSKNNDGSAINLGGIGPFIVVNNYFDTGKGVNITDENMWAATPYVGTHPDLYNVIVSENIFVDPIYPYISVGDTRSAQVISSHEIVISNNVVQVSAAAVANILVGNADHVLISGNALNGGGVQINYCRQATVRDNVINGRNYSAANMSGVWVFARSDNVEQFDIYIKDNELMNWEDGPIRISTFVSAEYTNVSIVDNDFIQRTGPTDGQYITVTDAARPLNVLTISDNRLNNIDYVPLRGTDVEMYYTTLNLGNVQTYVGSFTRDISTASGTQAITGVGFTPKAIIFAAAEDTGNMASWGFADYTTGENIHNADNVSAGTFGMSANAIRVVDGAGNTYHGNVSALGADGFTITWVKTGTPTGTITVYYMAMK